jgi:peptide/nickel transport system substrate-binding protein
MPIMQWRFPGPGFRLFLRSAGRLGPRPHLRAARWFVGWFTAALALMAQPISVALNKPIQSLNPVLLSREVEVEVLDLVFDRLVAIDERGAFVPQMLESWDISKDGRDILLKLRPGLTWQDGTPVEAEDLVETWRMASLPRVRKIQDLVGVRTLDSLKAEGPYRVRIHLKKARATLLSDLYNFIPVPRRHYVPGKEPLQDAVNFAPIGSGPYRVLSGANGKDVQLQRWPGYAGPHPGRWEAFRFRLHPADNEAYRRQLLAGEYHAADLDWFRHYLLRCGAFGNGALLAQSAPMATYECLWFNCKPGRSLLADRRIRMALSEALPWEFLLAQRRFRVARLADCLWPPQSWAWEPTIEELPRWERAYGLLEEAGWTRGPDGICQDAKGRRLKLVMYSERGSGERDHAQAFCEAARKIGIDIELRRATFDEIQDFSLREKGDIWDYAWSTSLDPDSESPLFTSEGIKVGANVMGYRNPEVDRLFEAGRHELDFERRRKIYYRINDLIQRDHPILQLNYGTAYLAVDRRLKGVAFNILGRTYGHLPGRRAWWLED